MVCYIHATNCLTDCRIVVLQNTFQSLLMQPSLPSASGTSSQAPLPTANVPVGNVNMFGEDGESVMQYDNN